MEKRDHFYKVRQAFTEETPKPYIRKEIEGEYAMWHWYLATWQKEPGKSGNGWEMFRI